MPAFGNAGKPVDGCLEDRSGATRPGIEELAETGHNVKGSDFIADQNGVWGDLQVSDGQSVEVGRVHGCEDASGALMPLILNGMNKLMKR